MKTNEAKRLRRDGKQAKFGRHIVSFVHEQWVRPVHSSPDLYLNNRNQRRWFGKGMNAGEEERLEEKTLGQRVETGEGRAWERGGGCIFWQREKRKRTKWAWPGCDFSLHQPSRSLLSRSRLLHKGLAARVRRRRAVIFVRRLPAEVAPSCPP